MSLFASHCPLNSVKKTIPGSVDEKLRSEVATYIWIHQIAQRFRPIAFMGSVSRWTNSQTLRSLLGYPTSCPYISLKRPTPLSTGYVIISIFNKSTGYAAFANLENEGIPTIPRNSVYQAVESYLLDLLQCNDNRIYHQPNAIHDTEDGQEQLAALTMMRALFPRFISREYRHGPFGLTLTDFQPGNIFADEEWYITDIIDFELATVLPVGLQTPVYWLTGRAIDAIEHGEHLDVFETRIHEYGDAFEDQEKKDACSNFPHAQIMRRCWNSGSFWYFQAVNCLKALLHVFREHVKLK
ncbi:uncharacterized protein P174DRAFT_435750 [Aspergillus novofumigatus IBT 16806]|uniref:Aminoglycoside phosphotransferase domain-containing protein n=1 Tax=Aspergillus novofumigatus (strain IBT 16806) TaxID=1392255 RepID=A0A2I1BUH1_ASPN1|nr:uncharacterized protein P174DRAFT_435750 [Aspergillus novofumigatus IBT 16806]PKX89050.1 hypothetical protein P174DRAFT_435750 [Aspergillus novofumigatus IBT 16806]